MLDAAKGMLHLHEHKPPILHRDLKSPNLLVCKNWEVKLSGAGRSDWKLLNALFASSLAVCLRSISGWALCQGWACLGSRLGHFLARVCSRP